ncbi:hypothetical protein CVD28_03750 [Bacillus sp. M6-12]|uniref:hypothetical protein n=1 Tax=Bacillus sp. M6-12 TaxID=2054166 RepID=UPI000C78AACF|nr:hypothetical protein [Bacillus sp. M6-12]PLS19542.1 hypothetical protein CVD28_03750 [Bacillus sp. M6-12]
MSNEPVKTEDIPQLVADLLFAYVNKDEDFPHPFETEAVEKAVSYLQMEYKGTMYNQEFFNRCKELSKPKYKE